MYLTGYIERMGTGTRDMIRRCVVAGLAEPECSVSDGFRTTIRRSGVTGQVAGQVAGEVARLLFVAEGEQSRVELQRRLGLKGRANFLRLYLEPTLEAGLLEMTRPDKPQSCLQKYCLTKEGRALLARLKSQRWTP